MPTRELQQHLHDLHQQLANSTPLDDADKAALVGVMNVIQTRLNNESAPGAETSLLDNIELTIDRFELSHPTLANSLRTITQLLSNIGI